MHVAVFITCFNDTLFPDTGRHTVELLERLGHEVSFPSEQTCCGQMHANSGYSPEARRLATRHARVFSEAGAEAVVTPSASCAAFIRHELREVAAETGSPGVAEAAAALAERTFELSQFLVGELGLEDVGAHYQHRVVYHPTCHSLRLLKVGDAPLRLLRAVGGLRLHELSDSEVCCGFGGTFAIKNPDVSVAMGGDKVNAIIASGAEVCTAVDNSCLMHLDGLLSRGRSGVRVVHLAEILASTRASTG